MNDKPGTDWEAKWAAAGQNANREQSESYTIADGTSVNPRDGQVPDSVILYILETPK